MPLVATKAFAAYVNGRAVKVKKGEALDGMPPAVQATLANAGVAKTAPQAKAKENNND